MGKKTTIVLFSGEMDKALAAFNIATGAASMGMEVTMFFTFWGLNVLRREKGGPKPQGLKRRLMALLNRGGARRLPLSKLHLLGLGTRMMKSVMTENKMPSVEEMIRLAKELGVKLVACTTTMGFMGLTRESLIPEADTLAGVATYLGEATEGQVNLFI